MPYKLFVPEKWKYHRLKKTPLISFCGNHHRRTSRDTASDPGRRRSLVRKWLAMISLLLSWLVLLGDLVLVPGMPVEVFIQTGERSPMAYLLKPLTDYFSRALRET